MLNIRGISWVFVEGQIVLRLSFQITIVVAKKFCCSGKPCEKSTRRRIRYLYNFWPHIKIHTYYTPNIWLKTFVHKITFQNLILLRFWFYLQITTACLTYWLDVLTRKIFLTKPWADLSWIFHKVSFLHSNE